MKRDILNKLLPIDKKIMKIINRGLWISLIIGVIGIFLILAYNTYSVTYDFYEGGFILIKTGLAFAAELIGLGIATNKLIKEKV